MKLTEADKLQHSSGAIAKRHRRARLIALLLSCSIMSAGINAAHAQQNDPQAAAAATPQGDLIHSITVSGSQRIEPDTVRSYIQLRIGDRYSQTMADQALKDLFETELFADVTIRNNQGAVVITVRENPIVNRVILEGNKRLKDDKIYPEIRMGPRQIYTPTKVRADVARIIELYKRQGRFAANVEPKRVELDQNRVDIIFEINEGARSKVRQINIIGNEKFSDGNLRSEMVTKQSRFFRFFSSSDTYDPDKMAYDQQKLRQFYLTEGYADFRVVSAVAELTPDKRDFIITYVVEEGDRYKFGDAKVESEIRDFTGESLNSQLPMEKGDWYNAKLVEDTVESLSETAGLFGYAFADVRPEYQPDREKLELNITFNLRESERVYIERIDVNGNTLTQDKVVRREFRLAEGDAFNTFLVKRSSNRIKSLGYFQENFEIEQKPGSAEDRLILEANVEENPTGELSLSAGYSSIENFILQFSVRQNNFRGRGQSLGLSASYSNFSKSLNLNFTEPALFDRNISFSANIYRQEIDGFNIVNSDRNDVYRQRVTGIGFSLGVPVTEYVSFLTRYSLSREKVNLPSDNFRDDDMDGITECITSLFLCDIVGSRTTSLVGVSLLFDNRDSRYRPTRGLAVSGHVDFAGLGGSVEYLKMRLNASRYWNFGSGFIFSIQGEGGHIIPFENRGDPADGIDDVRLTDRFYLGEPQVRGYAVRGIGPRVATEEYLLLDGLPQTSGEIVNQPARENFDDYPDIAIGGRSYYRGRAELEIPLGSGARELGLRPSIYLDIGAVWDVVTPALRSRQRFNTDGELLYYILGQPSDTVTNTDGTMTTTPRVDDMGNPVIEVMTTTAATDGAGNANTPALISQEFFFGNSSSPRISVGAGVDWNSPFGPFRFDFAYSIKEVFGDDTKRFSFNVGTQF